MGNRWVVPSPDGGWDVKKEGADRSSGHFDRKQDAIGRGREIVRNDGGGELRIQNRDGRLIDSDTIAPGNESPRRDTR